MHPILFEIGRFPVYTYGVLLAAAYLLGLQFALVARAQAGLDPNRVMDLGIWIIISALVGAKLLLFVVEFDTFGRNPGTADARAGWRGVLRRTDRRRCRSRSGICGAIACRCGHGRRVRAGHRARARHWPHGLFLRRLLLRSPTDVPGRSRSTIRMRRRTSARL